MSPQKTPVDLIVHHARIYSVDPGFGIADAMAIRDGRIVAVGSGENIHANYSAADELDAAGRPVYPGFIDPHCHFLSYGQQLSQVDLAGCTSFAECLHRLQKASNGQPWMVGSGWNHMLWPDKKLPDRAEIDAAFPDKPVILTRVDRHCAVVNSAALSIAGIDAATIVDGGFVEVANGSPTGILVDAAIEQVTRHLPKYGAADNTKALQRAQEKIFAAGLTGVGDALLELDEVLLIDALQQAGQLQVNINGMLNPTREAKEFLFARGRWKTNTLTVGALKYFADGALGSRGAAMLEAYSDDPGNKGILIHSEAFLQKEAEDIYRHGLQMNTHAIGDAANKLVLDVYGRVLKGKNDRRWRIEHAQILRPEDLARFAAYSVIPSVQTTHATSDMPWVEGRIGKDRLGYAYAYKRLLDTCGVLPNGSDFPVEGINPLLGFYAAISRKDPAGNPEEGFLSHDKLSRREALQAMTIWAAYAGFDEDRIGSLEPGKQADFVMLEEDIMEAEEKDIPQVKVAATFVRGEKVYGVGSWR